MRKTNFLAPKWGVDLYMGKYGTFLYYANEERDDVIGGSLKHCNTQSRISPEVLEQHSSNLAPEMYITRETQ